MKKVNFSILMAGVLALTVLGSCKKDNENTGKMVFKAQLQQPNEGMRTSIQPDGTVLWTAGDAIKVYNGVNQAVFDISDGIGTTSATFTGNLAEADIYYAAYPALTASIATVEDNKVVTFTLPETQSVGTTAGDFDKNVSLMVSASNTQNFGFKNVFGILALDMKSANGVNHVSRFTLTAKDDVNIWGTGCSVTLNDDNTFSNFQLVGGTSSITLTCDITLTDAAQTFYIMVPPVAMTSGLELKIYNNDAEIYSLETTDPVTIGSNAGATFQHNNGSGNEPIVIEPEEPASTVPTGAINGLFSVSAGRQVYFSQGNLQYMPSSATWRFAEHQYDICVSANEMTYRIKPMNDYWAAWQVVTAEEYWAYVATAESDPDVEHNYYYEAFYDATSMYASGGTSWIELFGWGTWGPGKTPYLVSTNNSDYAWSGDFSGTISNGDATGWYTLSNDEWVYLFTGRANAASKYGFGTVAGVNGLIVLPDAFTDPYKNGGSNAFVPCDDGSFEDNVYTLENWAYMESAGAVFLPSAGFRPDYEGPIIELIGEWATYWSRTPYNSTWAYGMIGVDGNRLWLDEDGACRNHVGCSVRLVCDVE